jgi:predicted amidohydrolase
MKFSAMNHQSSTEASTPESLRIGVVQFAMKPTADLGAFESEISFLIRTVASYRADIVVFPEYVNAALMARFDHLGTVAAIRELASLTPGLLQFFKRQAVEHRINIITGSLPLFENGRLTNVVFPCRRDGTWESQEKLHVTPSEVSEWRMSGGNSLRAFDTDCGRGARTWKCSLRGLPSSVPRTSPFRKTRWSPKPGPAARPSSSPT